MLMTVILILVLAALVTTIAAAMNKCPIWVPLFVLVVVELLRCLPLR
jgi:hypothetical protein